MYGYFVDTTTKIHFFGIARNLQKNPAFVNQLKEDVKKL
jgi:hypothetical protein